METRETYLGPDIRSGKRVAIGVRDGAGGGASVLVFVGNRERVLTFIARRLAGYIPPFFILCIEGTLSDKENGKLDLMGRVACSGQGMPVMVVANPKTNLQLLSELLPVHATFLFGASVTVTDHVSGSVHTLCDQ